MLRFLLGVAVGASLSAFFRHAYQEREKQRVAAELAKLHEQKDAGQAGP